MKFLRVERALLDHLWIAFHPFEGISRKDIHFYKNTVFPFAGIYGVFGY